MPVRPPSATAPGVGIGLRQPHYRQVVEDAPRLGFIEVHSENFFADGGAALAVLHETRARYPVSLHGVGLGLGSAAGVDPWHLDRLERLVRRIDPVRVSDHASFARIARNEGMVHAADLLPIAFSDGALDILAGNVEAVQDRLRRPILVENLSAYVAFADDAIDEAAFFARLCRRTGCGLLLDVNNVFVSATNHGTSALDYLADFPLSRVEEIHLAGHAEQADDEGDLLLIDSHDGPVADAVWRLYELVIGRRGAVPTLIEWDSKIPDWPVLQAEAAAAQAILDRHQSAATGGERHAA